MRTALAVWLGAQPRGAASHLARKTGLDYGTIHRAKRGFAVLRDTAELISRATRGAVKMSEISQVKVGRARRSGAPADADADADDPRAVA